MFDAITFLKDVVYIISCFNAYAGWLQSYFNTVNTTKIFENENAICYFTSIYWERECMTENRYRRAKIIHIGRLMDANNCASCRIGITKRSIIQIVPITNNLSFLSIF